MSVGATARSNVAGDGSEASGSARPRPLAPGEVTAETLPPPDDAAPAADPGEPRRDPRYPARLGRYRLLRQIGLGGMGVVFLAHDELLDREVAIKFLFRREAASDDQTRLLREAQALARLSHPNVIAVHETAEHDGHVFIVMEFVVGATLRTCLRERSRTPAQLLGLMIQAGEGLAALHAAGLVHRDIKPDNIMVGDDGRVRVMDFGLARAADEPLEPLTDTSLSSAGLSSASLSASNLLAAEVTRTGAMLGTPGYMAPEQYFREAPTARSDIFSFCVVLFEAFHGKRPFTGDSPVEIRDRILRGEFRPPTGAVVPRWIDAIARRGLRPTPEDRWPSMPALLAALADDPVARRLRIARAAAAFVLVGGVVALLVFAYTSYRRDRAAEAAEARAAQHLNAVEQAIRRADDAGNAPLAEATFEAFLADPSNAGTRAFSGAWQLRGDRARTHGRLDDALAGYAQAYVHATADADAALALRSMAEVFHGQRRGLQLGRVLAALRPREPVPVALELDAALMERDLPAAADALAGVAADDPLARWRPLLAPLRLGRRVGPPPRSFVRLPPGARAAFAATGPHLGVTLYDEALTRVGELLPEHLVQGVIPGTTWSHVDRGGASQLLDIFDPDHPVWDDGAAPLFRAVRVDVPGDARPSLLIGRAFPQLGFRLLREPGGPDAREQIAHDATDRARSELSAALVADLDGDGHDELFAAIGPWHAFALQVHGVDAGGAFPLLDRRRLGRIGGLAALRRGDERLLAVLKDDASPAPDVFPAPPHTGAPAGVYLFRWTGRALVDAGHLPLQGAEEIRGPALAADLDGDGDDELLFTTGRARHDLGLVRLRGGMSAQRLAGVRVLAAAQLDSDPGDELLVNLDGGDLWALGSGDAPPPALHPSPLPLRAPPAELADPLLLDRWSRAARLVDLGLPSTAASILEEAGNLAVDRRAGARLLDQAARLHGEQGELTAAIAIDARIAGDPELGAGALARRAPALLHAGRYDDALATVLALLEHPARDREHEADARVLLRELTGLTAVHRRLDLLFDGPLDPAWRLLRPGALRRDAARRVLTITAAGGRDLLAELPLVYTGGPLALAVEFDVQRLEYGACLRIDLLDEAGSASFGARYCGIGGGARLARVPQVEASGRAWQPFEAHLVESAWTAEHIAYRLTYLPDRRTLEITVETPAGAHTTALRDLPAAAPGRYRLALSAPEHGASPTLIAAELRRLGLRGVAVADAGGDPEDPARLLVEGDAAGAVRRLDVVTPPDANLIRLLASDELRDSAGLALALRALRPHLDDPSLAPTLTLLLRTRPAATTALQAELGPALLPHLLRAWSLMSQHRADTALRREALRELRRLDILAPTNDDERAAARRLLAVRGDLYAREGDRPRAARDFASALELAPVDTRDDLEARRDLHVRLAGLTLASSPDIALGHANAALALTDAPELARDSLMSLPGVERKRDADPRWRALLPD